MTVFTKTGIKVNDLHCPVCQAGGNVNGDSWFCQSCKTQFQYRVLCDVCGSAVRRLKACGGFEEYYCNACHIAKSKSKVIYELSST